MNVKLSFKNRIGKGVKNMRKCLRCNAEMIEDLDVKVEGGAYGLKVTQQGIFKESLVKLDVLFAQSVDILKLIFKILQK